MVAAIGKMSTPINEKNKREITQIATIAGNNDPTIGSYLADAFMKVGKDGVITIEEGKQSETTVDVVEGMQFDRGFLSPHFVTNQDEQTVEFEKAARFDSRREDFQRPGSLVPLLEAVSRANKPLLIIAEDVEGEALATLVVNKMRGILNVCAVKAPGYGDRRKAMLGDLAVLTGGNAIFKGLGVQLDSVKLSDLGTILIASLFQPTIRRLLAAKATRRPSQAGRRSIRKEIETTTSDYDKEKKRERLTKLAGGVAQIRVGGATETEMKDLGSSAATTPARRPGRGWKRASCPAAKWPSFDTRRPSTPCSSKAVKKKRQDRPQRTGSSAQGHCQQRRTRRSSCRPQKVRSLKKKE